MFVADLSYLLRKRTGGTVCLLSAALKMSENMVCTSSALDKFAGLAAGPTSRKWSRKA
jgi:hypothetical protein